MKENKDFEYPFVRWSIREGMVYGVAHVNGSGDASWYAEAGGRDIEMNHTILEENPCEKGVKTFEIASNCFRATAQFKTMKLPSSLVAIHDYAFEGSAIETISFPKKLCYIDNFAFANCHNLKKVTNSSKDLHLGYWCFSNCVSLTTMSIPSTHVVPGYCFFGCANLKDVFLDSIEYIDKTAFQYYDEASKSNKNLDVTLHGKQDSYVESFAKENGFHFAVID
jgi:hypothetical protein